ncbi:unnamed protein product [Victoria cruziana]
MSLNGFSTASDLILSSVRHFSSASTSAPEPRTRCRARLASSILPRRIRLLAVSGTSSVPAVMISAGTAARPSESRQPHPWTLAVETGDDRAPPFWWRHLGQIKWGEVSAYLVGEADSETKQDATDDEHGHIDGGAVDGGAGEEGCTAEQHTGSASESPSDSTGSQRTHQAGYLAVVHAVLILLCLHHLPQHRREKPLQERPHGRHSTCR